MALTLANMQYEVGNISDEPSGRLFLLPWVPSGLRTLVERHSRLAPILTLVVALYCVTTLMSGCVTPRSTNQGTNTEALGTANSRPTVETPFTPEDEESEVDLGSNSDGTDGTTSDLEVIVEPSPVPTATPIRTPAPEPTNTPTPQLTETPTATPTATEVVRALLEVVSKTLNVRGGPGTNYPVKGGLEKGDVLEIIGKADNGWWNVILANRTEGWVSGGEQYTTASNAEEVPVVKTPEPPPTATPAPTRQETSVSQPGTSESRVFSKLIINNSPTAVDVPVYGTPNLEGLVVYTLGINGSLPASAQEEWWFPVQLPNGSTGYIHLSSFQGGMSYLDRTPAPPNPEMAVNNTATSFSMPHLFENRSLLNTSGSLLSWLISIGYSTLPGGVVTGYSPEAGGYYLGNIGEGLTLATIVGEYQDTGSSYVLPVKLADGTATSITIARTARVVYFGRDDVIGETGGWSKYLTGVVINPELLTVGKTIAAGNHHVGLSN